MELFKNNQDQILRSSSGNIMTRPYDFGNAFVNESNNYIQVNREFSQYLNLYAWVYEPLILGEQTYLFYSENTNDDYFSLRYRRMNSNAFYSKNRADLNGTSTNCLWWNTGAITITNPGVNLFSLNLRENGINSLKVNGNTTITRTQTTTNDYPLTKIELGRLFNNYNTGTRRINRVFLLDRELTSDELNYLYNNKLGRNPLTEEGLILDIRNNFAEILDFSEEQDGSDTRVGVRDFSGNNYHGEIMNLPAGTLEEQLNYANANLFKSFL